MPSGSKRRKAAAAAKKKKEQLSPTPSGSQATTFNGGDDVKGQESDGGEVNSPASQDLIPSGAQSFNEEVVVDKSSSPVRLIDSEKVNVEEDSVVKEVGIVKVDEDEGRVEITRELKLDEVSGGRGGDLSVEVGKNSDSSSSSSSSDDEEIHIRKTEVVLDPAKVEKVYEAVENSDDPVVPDVALEEAVESAEESKASATVLEDVVESTEEPWVSAVVLEDVVTTADDSQVPVVVFEEGVETVDDSQVPPVVFEEVVEIAGFYQVPAIVLEEVVSVSEAAPVAELYGDLDKPILSELNSELKATKEDALPAILPTVVSHGESSNVGSFDVKDAEAYVLPPSDSPVAVIRNGAGYHLKDPEIHESFENQTPALQAPLSVQRTTWKGCCGLFEVFTGSR